MGLVCCPRCGHIMSRFKCQCGFELFRGAPRPEQRELPLHYPSEPLKIPDGQFPP